jgi:hypothetical protein
MRYLEPASRMISGRKQAMGALHSRTIANNIEAAKTAKISARCRIVLLL